MSTFQIKSSRVTNKEDTEGGMDQTMESKGQHENPKVAL